MKGQDRTGKPALTEGSSPCVQGATQALLFGLRHPPDDKPDGYKDSYEGEDEPRLLCGTFTVRTDNNYAFRNAYRRYLCNQSIPFFRCATVIYGFEIFVLSK